MRHEHTDLFNVDDLMTDVDTEVWVFLNIRCTHPNLEVGMVQVEMFRFGHSISHEIQVLTEDCIEYRRLRSKRVNVPR